MYLPGGRGQNDQYDLLTFSGTITTGGTAQTLLPAQRRRSYLMIQNTSAGILTIGVGPATATATLSAGKITGIAAVNAGLGYTIAPRVMLLGGIIAGDFSTDMAASVAPSFRVAQATCVLSGSGIGAFTMSDQGLGYLVAPYVYLYNPWEEMGGGISGAGAILPSATAGILLATGDAWICDNSAVPTGAVNIFGATTAQTFECKVGI